MDGFMILGIVLLAAGFLFVGIETLIPGFGAPGILGGCCLVAGVSVSYTHLTLPTTLSV